MYTVNSYDICTPGMERLRSNSEFIIPVRVYHGLKAEEIRTCMLDDIGQYEHPDGFDYGACRKAIKAFCDSELKGREHKLWGKIAYDPEDDEGVSLFVYMTGPGYSQPETD